MLSSSHVLELLSDKGKPVGSLTLTTVFRHEGPAPPGQQQLQQQQQQQPAMGVPAAYGQPFQVGGAWVVACCRKPVCSAMSTGSSTP